MPDMRLKTWTLLASATVDLQNGDGNTTVYTVPAGYKAFPMWYVLREPTASLAGGTDFDFGDSATSNWFAQAVSYHNMTSTTMFQLGYTTEIFQVVFNAGDLFEVVVNTGATADAQATLDLFGYLVAV